MLASETSGIAFLPMQQQKTTIESARGRSANRSKRDPDDICGGVSHIGLGLGSCEIRSRRFGRSPWLPRQNRARGCSPTVS